MFPPLPSPSPSPLPSPLPSPDPADWLDELGEELVVLDEVGSGIELPPTPPFPPAVDDGDEVVIGMLPPPFSPSLPLSPSSPSSSSSSPSPLDPVSSAPVTELVVGDGEGLELVEEGGGVMDGPLPP